MSSSVRDNVARVGVKKGANGLTTVLPTLSKDGNIALNFNFDMAVAKGKFQCCNCKRHSKNTFTMKFTRYSEGKFYKYCKHCVAFKNEQSIVKIPKSVLSLSVKKAEEITHNVRKYHSQLLCNDLKGVESFEAVRGVAESLLETLKTEWVLRTAKEREIVVYFVIGKLLLYRNLRADLKKGLLDTVSLLELAVPCPVTSSNLQFKDYRLDGANLEIDYSIPTIYGSCIRLVNFEHLIPLKIH